MQGQRMWGELPHTRRRRRNRAFRGRQALSSARGAAAATSQKPSSTKMSSSSTAQSLAVSGLSKAFATTAVLLKDVSFTVNQGERVGLVGWNGAGKTTVLRIIRGETEADAGDVRMMKNAKVASLNQEVRLKMIHEAVHMIGLPLSPYPLSCFAPIELLKSSSICLRACARRA